MIIKLINLMPLSENTDIPKNDTLAENLKTYVNTALYGTTIPAKFKYGVNILKGDRGEYEIEIERLYKILAYPMRDPYKNIIGWKFNQVGKTGEYTMKLGPNNKYFGNFKKLFNNIKREIATNQNTKVNSDLDDGSKLQLNVDVLTHYINEIKSMIDKHDWYYELTDAHNSYVTGSKQISNIKKIYEKLPKSGREEIFNYWNSKSPSMFKYDNFKDFNNYFAFRRI
jgi:hypothetical protein